MGIGIGQNQKYRASVSESIKYEYRHRYRYRPKTWYRRISTFIFIASSHNATGERAYPVSIEEYNDDEIENGVIFQT